MATGKDAIRQRCALGLDNGKTGRPPVWPNNGPNWLTLARPRATAQQLRSSDGKARVWSRRKPQRRLNPLRGSQIVVQIGSEMLSPPRGGPLTIHRKQEPSV